MQIHFDRSYLDMRLEIAEQHRKAWVNDLCGPSRSRDILTNIYMSSVNVLRSESPSVPCFTSTLTSGRDKSKMAASMKRWNVGCSHVYDGLLTLNAIQQWIYIVNNQGMQCSTLETCNFVKELSETDEKRKKPVQEGLCCRLSFGNWRGAMQTMQTPL